MRPRRDQIEGWRREGYSFLVVHELLQQRGVEYSETTVRRYMACDKQDEKAEAAGSPSDQAAAPRAPPSAPPTRREYGVPEYQRKEHPLPDHRHLTDHQVRLYTSLRRQDTPSEAAAKASFSTATAYRIESDPRPPSQKQTPRGSRRRDPLNGIFEKQVVPLLVECPALRAVTIFEELRRRDPQLPASVRRTLERRVRRWRALHGPEQEVIFAQRNPPGRLGLSDFTAPGHLGVTIAGVPLEHLLYHFRLPYSGFEYADVVLGGESFVALSGGCQSALWLLGGVPPTAPYRQPGRPPTTTLIKPPLRSHPPLPGIVRPLRHAPHAVVRVRQVQAGAQVLHASLVALLDNAVMRRRTWFDVCSPYPRFLYPCPPCSGPGAARCDGNKYPARSRTRLRMNAMAKPWVKATAAGAAPRETLIFMVTARLAVPSSIEHVAHHLAFIRVDYPILGHCRARVPVEFERPIAPVCRWRKNLHYQDRRTDDPGGVT